MLLHAQAAVCGPLLCVHEDEYMHARKQAFYRVLCVFCRMFDVSGDEGVIVLQRPVHRLLYVTLSRSACFMLFLF